MDSTEKIVFEFDYMRMDTVLAHVKLTNNGVQFENFCDDPVFLPFGIKEKASLNDLYEFFEDRCFPRTRGNCDEVLESMGLTKYDPYEIVKRTNGFMYDSLCWIKFSTDKDLTWDKLRIKFRLNN